MKPEEVKDSTLEDIILGLKSELYRNNVASAGEPDMRKSFHRERSDSPTNIGIVRDMVSVATMVVVSAGVDI